MFDKFHKIPNQQKNELAPANYTVQEKLDGANAGLQLMEYNGTCSVIVHSRNQILAQVFPDVSGPIVELHQTQLGAFHQLVEQVKENLGSIIDYMRDHDYKHIYGEWLVKHTIEYPGDMYNKFYPFDAVTQDDIFVRPAYTTDLPEMFERIISVAVSVADGEEQEEFVRSTTLRIQTGVARRMEGTVWKRYDLDLQSKLDQYGQRYCYKDILPEFREDHRNNPEFSAPLEPQTKEQRLVAYLPDRSLEKILQKLETANGGWKRKLIGTFIERVWQEFLEEHLNGALKAEKMPKIDTKRLYNLLAERSRLYVTPLPEVKNEDTA